MKFFRSIIIMVMLVVITSLPANIKLYGAEAMNENLKEKISVDCEAKTAQIETGGPFVGVRFEKGMPLPAKIAFFYPVANTIDLVEATGGGEYPLALYLGIKVGDSEPELIGLKPFKRRLNPYSVDFYDSDKQKSVDISYNFCIGKPAMIVRIDITNKSDKTLPFEVYTHFDSLLMTCHTYNLKDKGWTEYDKTGRAVYINYDDSEAANAQVFIANAGEMPESFNAEGKSCPAPGAGENPWMNGASVLPGKLIDKSKPSHPAAAYIYKKTLAPEQKISIIQIIGSSKQDEGRDIVSYLLKNHEKETALYEEYVLGKAFEGILETGELVLDKSVSWAKAIHAVNSHYLDGEMIPMPCPEGYNFFFTHDALMTSMGMVNYDTPYVKHILKYIARHARQDNVIPHAYYWKDDKYVTEYTTPDNWNNLWFVSISARYLRHSKDKETLLKIYPLVEKCISEALINLKEDDLIWAYRPDWWDLGRSFGPRAYMTIHTIRALREFDFISTELGKESPKLAEYEKLSYRMQKGLVDKLWDRKLKFLMNYYADNKKDDHYYIGSLLAAHFDLLDDKIAGELVKTAKDKMLDEKIGVYSVTPMDAQNMIDFLKLAGNEAGDPFTYINGGIWQQGNAWYALALMKDGKKSEALDFIKTTMTIDGIAKGPNGQIAMYENRNSNRNNPDDYGLVEKPQFLWAAGWYLYSLYHLFGVDETPWNIAFDPYLYDGQKSCRFTLTAGGRLLDVNVTGQGDYIKSIKYAGESYPSAVIPENPPEGDIVSIEMGSPAGPYLLGTDSILASAELDEGNHLLTLNLRAFKGHENRTEVILPAKPESVIIDGKKNDTWRLEQDGEIHRLKIDFIHESDTAVIKVGY